MAEGEDRPAEDDNSSDEDEEIVELYAIRQHICESKGKFEARFFEGGEVLVLYCLGHSGHAVENAALPISAIEQRQIIHLLKEQRRSIASVVDFLRSGDASWITPRLQLVTRQDLRNLSERCKLVPGKRHENDLTSVKLRVEEEGEKGGFRYFRLPDATTKTTFAMGQTEAGRRFIEPQIYTLSPSGSSVVRIAAGLRRRGAAGVRSLQSDGDERQQHIRPHRIKCTCDRNKNIHCLECDVCPYKIYCSCLDNRAGVSCKHAHRLQLYLTETTNDNEALADNYDPFQPSAAASFTPTRLNTSKTPMPSISGMGKSQMAKSDVLTLIERINNRVAAAYTSATKYLNEESIRKEADDVHHVLRAPQKLALAIRLEKRIDKTRRDRERCRTAELEAKRRRDDLMTPCTT